MTWWWGRGEHRARGSLALAALLGEPGAGGVVHEVVGFDLGAAGVDHAAGQGVLRVVEGPVLEDVLLQVLCLEFEVHQFELVVQVVGQLLFLQFVLLFVHV